MTDDPTIQGEQPDDALLQEARDRFKSCIDAEAELRPLWLADLQFERGGRNQWSEAALRLRDDAINPRPVITINKTRVHCRQVINDLRQQRPGIKVLPVDDKADIKTAQALEGIIRNIEAVSDAATAYDMAAHPQVVAGIGYWRVIAERVDEALNQQEPRILPVWNPLSVYLDPMAQFPDGRDAEFGFVVDDMRKEEAMRLYGLAESDMPSWDDKGVGGGTMAAWLPEAGLVRIAEYFRIERKDREFVQTTDGEYERAVYEALPPEGRPLPVSVTSRKVKCCYWYRITGTKVLETRELPTQYVPIVRVVGDWTLIDGKRDVRGLVRDMKDPARVYNYSVTTNAEIVALQPKAPHVGPAAAFEGHEKDWDAAHFRNIPRLAYNHIDENGNPIPRPERSQPPVPSPAMMAMMQQADGDLMAAAGRFEASLGQQGDEQSGRAIIARQRQGDNATFHFGANQAAAIAQTGRILVDMIPRLYDTARIARILGEDGKPDFARLDPSQPSAFAETEQDDGSRVQLYNVTAGRYDVMVTTGPNYATKRQETAAQMVELVRSDPTLTQKAGDIIVRNLDIQGADALADRLKLFLPPEVQQAADAQNGDAEAAKMAAVEQAIVAQVQPIMEQMQAALQEAEAAAAEKDARIAELEAQVASKEGEQQTKLAEAAMKRETEMARVEADVAIAAITAMGGEKDDDEGESETPEAAPQPQTVVIVDKAAQEGFAALSEALAQIAARVDQQGEHLMSIAERVDRPRTKRGRIAMDADGMPTGEFEVIEEAMH